MLWLRWWSVQITDRSARPILAVYAVYKTPAQLIPRYNIADSETRQAFDQVFAMWQPFAKSQRELFRQSAPLARVVEIEGASHYIFISNREESPARDASIPSTPFAVKIATQLNYCDRVTRRLAKDPPDPSPTQRPRDP